MVFLAEEAVFPQGKFVARNQLPLAGAAPETLDVVDFRLRPHYEVVSAEAEATFVALRPE